MRILSCCVAVAALLAGTRVSSATVHVSIDLTHQRMHVEGDDGTWDWPISSARSGFSTPGGSFAPTRLELMHYSRKYHMSPMPHAIFFRGGYAIHGTDATGSLGRPASHGCVRLSPGNATTLYDMVEREGARISISGTPPASPPFAVARGRVRRPVYAATEGYADEASDRRFVPRRPARRERVGYGDDQNYGYGYAPRQPQYYYYPRPAYPYAPAYYGDAGFAGGTRYRQVQPLPGYGY